MEDLPLLVSGLGNVVPKDQRGDDGEGDPSGMYDLGDEGAVVESVTHLRRLLHQEYCSALPQDVEEKENILGEAPQREMYLKMGEWRVAQLHLFPILCCFRTDWKLVLPVMKLLVTLTLPPPEGSSDVPAQYGVLHSVRQAFLARDVFPIFVGMLEPLLRTRLTFVTGLSTTQAQYFEFTLVLLANILKVPNDNFNSTLEENRVAWNTLVQTFHESVFDFLIITISTNNVKLQQHRDGTVAKAKVDEDDTLEEGGDETQGHLTQWNVLILEILVCLFQSEELEELAHQSPKVKTSSSRANEKMKQLLRAEKKEETLNRPTGFIPHRHTNFGGVMVGKRGGTRSLLTTEHFFRNEGIPETEKKKPWTKRSHRMQDMDSKSSVLTKRCLADMMERYLGECHDDYMAALAPHIRTCSMEMEQEIAAGDAEAATASGKAKSDDVSHFLTWARVVTGYARALQQVTRSANPRMDAVSTFLNYDTFELAFSKVLFWQQRKHFRKLRSAVGLLKELFTLLCVIHDNSKVVEIQTAASGLAAKVVHNRMDLDMIVQLLKDYQPFNNPMSYLSDLVQLAQVVIQTMEHVSSRGQLVVQKKKKKKKFKRRKPGPMGIPEGMEQGEEPTQPQDPDEVLDWNALGEDSGGGDEEEEEEYIEQPLSMEEYLGAYIHPHVLSSYLELLRGYATNSRAANFCLTRMLDRVAFTLSSIGAITNIGYLVMYQAILSDPDGPVRHRSLSALTRRIVAEYFRLVAARPHIALYSTFWMVKSDAQMLSLQFTPQRLLAVERRGVAVAIAAIAATIVGAQVAVDAPASLLHDGQSSVLDGEPPHKRPRAGDPPPSVEEVAGLPPKGSSPPPLDPSEMEEIMRREAEEAEPDVPVELWFS